MEMVDPGIHTLDGCHDTVESRYKYNEVSIYFLPAWILEETESVLLNLGKCSKPKDTHMQAQDAEEREAQSKRNVSLR